MESTIYNIENVNFLFSLSEDELRKEIDKISLHQIYALNCICFGSPSIGIANGLGAYLYSQYLNLKNRLYPQKKRIKDIMEERMQMLRNSICSSDVLKNFVEGKLHEADLAIGIAMIIAQKEGVTAELSLLLSVYLIKKGVLSYCYNEWTL